MAYQLFLNENGLCPVCGEKLNYRKAALTYRKLKTVFVPEFGWEIPVLQVLHKNCEVSNATAE